MLASNQPYQRVDDGVGAGLVGGAVVGGALSAGAIYGGSSAIRKLAMTDLSRTSKRATKVMDNPTEKNVSKMKKFVDRAGTRQDMYEGASKYTNKLGQMSGKRKAMAIGGSVIASSLLGAGIDNLNG